MGAGDLLTVLLSGVAGGANSFGKSAEDKAAEAKALRLAQAKRMTDIQDSLLKSIFDASAKTQADRGQLSPDLSGIFQSLSDSTSPVPITTDIFGGGGKSKKTPTGPLKTVFTPQVAPQAQDVSVEHSLEELQQALASKLKLGK